MTIILDQTLSFLSSLVLIHKPSMKGLLYLVNHVGYVVTGHSKPQKVIKMISWKMDTGRKCYVDPSHLGIKQVSFSRVLAIYVSDVFQMEH